MREAELLTRIYARSEGLRDEFPQVLVGPGDDCAVLAVAGGSVLLKTDQLIEGRHFVRGTALELVARKAVARSVSDIAAMGGTPTATLAACALPHGFPQKAADELFEACSAWARNFGAPLVGGDIATFVGGDAALTLTITAVGVPHAVRGPVLRSTARPGDAVYVTGAVGGSFEKATGMGRHLTFEPRVKEGLWLAGEVGAGLHAMMDLSDGVGMDAGRMGAASGVGVELEAALLPRHVEHGRVVVGGEDVAVLEAVGAGEDYELLFAVGAGVVVPEVCPVTGTAMTRIGRCVEGAGAWMKMMGGERVDVASRGWEHK